MEFVLDANVLISALIKDSHTRHFLILSGHSFYVPEYIFQEIDEHIQELRQKTSLLEHELKEILDHIILLANIHIIPFDEFQEYKHQALILSPDPDDVAYVVLALKLQCAL